jgi:hypothetical protein
MYSPKIPEHLIPALYHLAHSRQQPMTALVAEILEAYLTAEGVEPQHDDGGIGSSAPIPH